MFTMSNNLLWLICGFIIGYFFSCIDIEYDDDEEDENEIPKHQEKKK